jgi:hypothetical protein
MKAVIIAALCRRSVGVVAKTQKHERHSKYADSVWEEIIGKPSG